MLAVSILDLRQIGLADRSEPLFLDGPHDFLLSHLAAKTAQRPLHLPQVPKSFTEIHITDCDITIAICNKQAKKFGANSREFMHYNLAAVPSGGQIHETVAFARCSRCHLYCDAGCGAVAGTQTGSGSVRE